MIRKAFAVVFSLLLFCGEAKAQCTSYPYTLTNGNTADASQVMADFNYMVGCLAGLSSGVTSFNGRTGAVTPSYGDYPWYAGSVNKLRNASLDDWFGGTSIPVTTSGGWTTEGIYVVPTGAAITASQVTNPLSSPRSYYGLKLLGAASNTDVKVRFVIESYDAAPLAGQTVTVQVPILNNSGASITPTITTKYANAQDNWATSTTDLASTNLQACANAATCTEAYTFTASSSANLGYEIVIDFGAIGNASYVVVGGGFDLRATPGLSTGVNSAPPKPEIGTTVTQSQWDKRFFQCTYDNGTAPATATHIGMVGAGINGTQAAYPFVAFDVPLRAIPTLNSWDGAGNASKYSTLSGVGGTSFADNVAQSQAPFNTSTRGFLMGNVGASNNAYAHFCADARISGG